MFVPIDLSRYTKKWLNRYLVARGHLQAHLQLAAFYGDNSFISINLANFVKHKPINEVITAEFFQFQENGKLRAVRNSDSEENFENPKLQSKWDDLPDGMVEARSISIEEYFKNFNIQCIIQFNTFLN